MSENLPVPREPDYLLPRQAETDAQVLCLWLHGRSRHTQRAYRRDACEFLRFVHKPLHAIRLGDLQAFADTLEQKGLADASRHRTLAAVKSLLAFAHRIGYLRFDVSRPIRLPAVRGRLTERILTEGQVQRMLALETSPRNHAILLTLYGAGLRVSELCGLRWRDLSPREAGGQISVWGKGEKSRVILLPPSVWSALEALKDSTGENDPVFRSRSGSALDPSQVWRIVRRAARRAGIAQCVSAHWLRHAHASHALDRGAPIHLVQATLGHASVATTGVYLHTRPTDSSSSYLPL